MEAFAQSMLPKWVFEEIQIKNNDMFGILNYFPFIQLSGLWFLKKYGTLKKNVMKSWKIIFGVILAGTPILDNFDNLNTKFYKLPKFGTHAKYNPKIIF